MVKPGVAFGDFIIKETTQKRGRDFGEHKEGIRNYFLPLFFAGLFLILFARLFFLQVVEGSYYRNLSDSNRTRTVVIHAPRGIIFDRNGVPLVYNTPGFRETVNGKTVFLSQSTALSMIANGNNDLEVDSLREYPYKEAFAQVVGYIGQISQSELSMPLYAGYGANDVVGKEGLEQYYESSLKGIDGKQLYEVDATGKLVRKLGQGDPIPGKNITTTLDLKLQLAVNEAMKDVKRGAAIVSSPKGEILAMVSKPSFDPNLFTMGQSYRPASNSSYFTVQSILDDSQNQPLLNRSISGVYPPGSTFKLIVASAGLMYKIIDGNWQIKDTGILRVGNFSFANWFYTDYGGTDGEVNVVKGIQRSNDIFFYTLAGKVGVDKVSEMAKKFGLGASLGIDLQGEASGLVPTQEWKLKNIGEPWYLGDTYHYGIGQGYLLTTPLQVNGWTQAIANGGTLYRPHLLKNEQPQIISSNLLDTNATNLIREGMVESCNPGGVAWPLFNFEVKNPNLKIDGKNILPVASASSDMRHVVLACKTGTAQVGGATTLPEAWMTVFAPAYDPQIIVTVLVENSGEGSNVAGPIAKQILQYYFGK